MALVPDTQIVLGDVTFAAYEVPERIAFGGEQRLVVQKYIGGGRVVEALGPDDKELRWSGRFQSPNAALRARHLDYLRRQGAAQTLSWDQFSYSVVIHAFEADFERAYQVPYRISCLVVADNTQTITTSPPPPVDELVSTDASALASLAPACANAAIASGVLSLQQHLAATGPLVAAPAAALAALLSRLASLSALIAGAIVAAGTTTAGGSVGAAGSGAGTAAAALVGQAGAAAVLAVLLEMQALAGRIAYNVQQASPAASARTITVAGGNLFQIAAAELGDATQWNRIAALNGLADPVLSGMMLLRLPPLDANAGGGFAT